MSTHRSILAAALAAAALAAGGCSDSPPPGAFTGTAYGERANAVLCERSDAIMGGSLSQAVSGDDDPAAAGARVLPALRTAYDHLAALEAPAGERDRAHRLLRAMRAALAEAEADPARLDSDEDPMTSVDAMLTDAGLGECL